MSAHKSVLCKWAYFKAALLGSFSEAESQSIKFPDETPEAIHALLEFAYSGDYTYNSLVQNHEDTEQLLSEMEFHARLYFLADKLGLPTLQKVAADRVYGSERTKGPKYYEKIDFQVARLVYSNTVPEDKLLRKTALEMVVELLTTETPTRNRTAAPSAFGSFGGFGDPQPQSASSGLFGKARPVKISQPSSPATQSYPANELLEELVAADPVFATDIIKCMIATKI